MTDPAAPRLFVLADRAFWLIWLGFPVLLWLAVQNVLQTPERLAALAPDQAACLNALPMVTRFSMPGQLAFWAAFAVEFAVYLVLLALAHRVIHRCAEGRVFVAEMIGLLRLIGLIIAIWPLVDLVMSNAAMAVFVALGDVATFQPVFALDLPVVGVGLLLIVMASAMRQAVRLRQDAELTI